MAEKDEKPIQQDQGKKDIEDILAEPPLADDEQRLRQAKEDDLDIEEAVEEPDSAGATMDEPAKEKLPAEEEAAESQPEPEPELEEPAKPEEKPQEAKKKKSWFKKKERKEKPRKVKEERTETASDAAPVIKEKKGSKLKTALIIILTILITAAAVLGGVYVYYKKYMKKTEEPKKEEVKVEEPKTEKETVYVNAADGLKLRKEPSVTSEQLAIIPFGTALEVLDTQGEWIKTTYDGKEGWVFASYTTKQNPLVYQNTQYGFQLTFKQSWAGYKFFEKQVDGVTVYYLGLPTTQTGWKSTGVDAGYSSMFAIDIYTADQWAKVGNEEPKPVKLGEKGNYVFAWSSAQSTPKDLEARFSEIKSIIDTFKVL